jgi:long-chain fatty acid transport protein
MRGTSLWRAMGLCSALAASVSQAQNYQPYPVGERASGLGGAYTALADDEAGAFYNPAGPAFTAKNSLSVSTSFYGIVSGTNRDSLGPGNDFKYSTLNLVPTTASSLWHLGPSTPESPAPLVLAINVFTPITYQLDNRSDVREGAVTLFQSVQDKTLLFGPSLSYRYSPRLGLGVALYGSLHSFAQRLDLTDVTPRETGGSDFRQLFISREEQNVGALAEVGARYELLEHLFLGASLRSPTLHVTGSGKLYTRLATARGEPQVASILSTTSDVSTQRRLPLRASLGAAYAVPRRFSVSADVTLHAPVSYDSILSEENPAVNESVEYGGVVNGAVGFEYYVTPSIPVRVGLFTDFSAAPEPSAVPGGSSEDHVDFYGATISLSAVTEHTSTSIGLVGAYGSAKLVGIDLSGPEYSLFETTGEQYRIYFTLSSSYAY